MNTTSKHVTVSALKSIGAAEVKAERAAEDVAVYILEDADLAADLDAVNVSGVVHLLATGCTCPTGKGKVCQCGKREAVAKNGKRTNYGRGVDAVAKRVPALLGKTAAEPDYIALARQAATAAVEKGEHNPADVIAAVTAALAGDAAE